MLVLLASCLAWQADGMEAKAMARWQISVDLSLKRSVSFANDPCTAPKTASSRWNVVFARRNARTSPGKGRAAACKAESATGA